jgi:hypothetical protein
MTTDNGGGQNVSNGEPWTKADLNVCKHDFNDCDETDGLDEWSSKWGRGTIVEIERLQAEVQRLKIELQKREARIDAVIANLEHTNGMLCDMLATVKQLGVRIDTPETPLTGCVLCHGTGVVLGGSDLCPNCNPIDPRDNQ